MRRSGPEAQMPPGFRFRPTDEELIVHYLCKKAAAQPFAMSIIAEVDLYKFDPWDLPAKALVGEKEFYFFSPRERKYPNGSRPNRAAGSGFWKATGVDKPISTSGGSQKVGVKKALVFYAGRAPKGVKTNWIMHEYRLADSGSKAAKRKGSLRLDDWVLCRIYNKTSSAQKALSREKSEEGRPGLDDILASFPATNEFKLPELSQWNSRQGCTAMEEDVKSDPNAVSQPSNEDSGHDSVGDNSEDSTLSSWLSFSSSVEQAPLPAPAALCPPTPPLSSALPLRDPPPLSSRPLSPPPPPAAAAAPSNTTTQSVSFPPLSSPLSAPFAPPAIHITTTSSSTTANAATCGYASQLDLLPFNFDGLPSPYGRLELLQSAFFEDGGDLGEFFCSDAAQYLQRLN